MSHHDAAKIIDEAVRPVFEDVESRTMMSVAMLDDHVLKIATTAGDDQIQVDLSDDGSQMWVDVNGVRSDSIAASSVYEMQVSDLQGDNAIYIDARCSANVYVTTGNGNDTVQTGRGNDVISTSGGRDVIDAGAGNDYVNAGGGNDKVNGGSGNDVLIGGLGRDAISADGGQDKLYGRKGDDKLYGDKDDQIEGDGGRNQVAQSSKVTIRADAYQAPRVTGLTVINSDTGKAVAGYEHLTNNSTLDSSKLPARYTLAADAEDGVKSVSFSTADGSFWRRVSGTEFTATAQASNGTYAAWAPTAGKTYAFAVASNSSANANGFWGETLKINMVVKAAAASTATGGNVTTGAAVDALAPNIKLATLADTAIAGQQFAIEASGTTIPKYDIEDAKFSWNFGDPSGKYNVLPGFNAAHVYERAGTYTATLTVTAPGGHVSVATRTVKVAASSYKTVYVAANGNDANDGSSTDRPVKTLVRASQLIDDDTKVLLRRGDTFGVTTTMGIGNDDVVLGAYGSGAGPIVRYEGARKLCMMIAVDKAATNVTIRDLTFTSIYDKDTNSDGMPHAILNGGTLVTIRDNTFLHVGYGINNNANPTGAYVVDNQAPLANGVRSYFCWTQGTDFVIVGNTVANSTREHAVRVGGTTNLLVAFNNLTNLDRRSIGDTLDYAKGALTLQASTNAYIADNVTHGCVSVGPLGGGDGVSHPNDRTEHVVVEDNEMYGYQVQVQHGAEHVTIRNNTIDVDNTALISVSGYNDLYKRGVVDLTIDHNVGIDAGGAGGFLTLYGPAQGITLTNNVFVAPHLAPGSGGTGAIYVMQNDLSSFSRIDNNVWPTAAAGSLWARGGEFIVSTSYTSESHLRLDEWNALSKVGDDSRQDVSESDAYKITPSMLAKAA